MALGEERWYLILHPKGYLKIGKEEGGGLAEKQRGSCHSIGGAGVTCSELLFSE